MFRVLFVCTGNICRSPTAERLLRHRLREEHGAGDVSVSSAGTGALVGEPVQAHAAALLKDAGVDVGGFAARDVTTDLIDEADLVLAMTRRHRGQVATLVPAATSRLFTLREFARLAAAADGSRASAGAGLAARFAFLVDAARAQRGLQQLADPADDDVPDPYGSPASAYELPYRLIAESVDAVIAALR